MLQPHDLWWSKITHTHANNEKRRVSMRIRILVYVLSWDWIFQSGQRSDNKKCSTISFIFLSCVDLLFPWLCLHCADSNLSQSISGSIQQIKRCANPSSTAGESMWVCAALAAMHVIRIWFAVSSINIFSAHRSTSSIIFLISLHYSFNFFYPWADSNL